MSHAQELITAIQTCSPGRVRAVIDQLARLSDNEVRHLEGSERLWNRKNYINDRLPGGLDITALHLAAKAYSAHADDATLGPIFNEMVGDLLEAGALPWPEIGCKRVKEVVSGREVARMTVGQTVVEVCDGRLPPALKQWMADNCDNSANIKGFAVKKHACTIRHQEAQLAAYHERKLGREEARELAMEMEDEEMEFQQSYANGY